MGSVSPTAPSALAHAPAPACCSSLSGSCYQGMVVGSVSPAAPLLILLMIITPPAPATSATATKGGLWGRCPPQPPFLPLLMVLFLPALLPLLLPLPGVMRGWSHATHLAMDHTYTFHTGSHEIAKLSAYQFPMF